MIYNSFWIRIFLWFLTLLIVTYFFNTKPKFILPTKYFHQNTYILSKTIKLFLILSVLLLPFDLQFITDKKIITEKVLPIQIVFDVSLSMAADDIQPSRFTAAKESVIRLVKKLTDYNISLITFSGIPFIYTPFSTDTQWIISALQDMSLADFPPTEDFIGTAIGDALLLGVHNLNTINATGVIIMITDGDSNKGYDPLDVLGIIKKKNIPVFTLGLGDWDYLIGEDKRWSPVKTSINIPLLQDISKQTGGEFYRILEENNFDEFFDHIKDLIIAQETQKIENQYRVLNQYLLSIILACLLFLLYVRLKNVKIAHFSD